MLNPLDYPDKFPVAGHSLPQGPFFLDRSDGCSRLGVILVDHNAHHRRMSHKTVALLARFLRHGWFDDYIRQDAFAVAILTFSEDRKRTFQNHVSPCDWRTTRLSAVEVASRSREQTAAVGPSSRHSGTRFDRHASRQENQHAMNTFAEQSIPPVEETAVHKTDVLDWSRLEAVTCDLDFRDEFHLEIGDMLAFTVPLLILLSFVSVVAWAVAHPVATWIAPQLDRTPIAVLSVARRCRLGRLGRSRATYRHRRSDCVTVPGRPRWDVPFCRPCSGRPSHSLGVSICSRAHSRTTAWSVLPFALLVFDRFATHAVYWITASPTSDHAAISIRPACVDMAACSALPPSIRKARPSPIRPLKR